MRRKPNPDRRGTILPLFALMLVGLTGFLALAIDIGIVAVAETQAQNAADNAALAGCRMLNGSTTSTSTSSATSTAQAASAINPILSKAATAAQTAVTHGAYHYNYSSQTFTAQFPPVAPDNYNLTQVVVTPGVSSFFSRVFGLTSLNVTATAQAAYRPRDVAMVLDFSGSMNNETDLWNCESYLGSYLNTPNNTDTVFPQWGVYSQSFSPACTFQCTSSSPTVGNCNITVPIGGIPALVNDFYSNSRGSSAASAFTAATTPTSTVPVGDMYLTTTRNTTATPAIDVAGISGSTSLTNTYNENFASQGYKYYTGKTFNGYTQGPNYWGKTFFIWPPDQVNDWRQDYFFNTDGVTPCNDNTDLWNSSGQFLNPSGNYVINYKAILAWITSSPNPFPSQLRAGNILYYSSIPTDVPSASYNPTTLNSTITNQNERFWKEYIDFVIGVWMDPTGNVQNPGSSTCSYGPDFACGNNANVSITGPDSSTKYNGVAFVAPTDNPMRPMHRFWFGPMTMIQYMLDTSISPGVFHDISMVPAKLGIAGAISDIQNNHPNDMVSMIYYARPSYAGEPTTVGVFDSPISSLGRSYTSISNSLWYPPNSGSADVLPWDANGKLTPRAHGDYDSNTATSYGLMLAYNQLSGNTALQSSGMGGYGRVGAQRLVILETDGLANASTSATTTNAGAYQGYFNIGPANSYSSSSTDPNTDAINVANQICALYNSSSYGLPGFSTVSKPVSIQTIAFGAIYEPTTSSTYNSAGISLLQSISTIGGSTFPSSSSDPTNGYKWCIGTLAQRQTKLQQAFTTILDSTVPISLVK